MDTQEDIFNNESNQPLSLLVKEPSNLKEALEKLPGLRKLAKEYYDLINQKELSETDADRISKIFELAEYDELLDKCIDKIDESIEIVRQIKAKKLSIEEFIEQVEEISPEEMTLEKFKGFCEQLYLKDSFIKKHIDFKDSEYCRKSILQTSFSSIYLTGWKPGQETGIHHHENSFNVVRVYQGTLTHRLYKEINHLYGKKGYRLIQENEVKENEWIYVDLAQTHQLANESNKNLVTLHFRYFRKTIEDKFLLSGNRKTLVN
jgi:cysteine dioxygenase